MLFRIKIRFPCTEKALGTDSRGYAVRVQGFRTLVGGLGLHASLKKRSLGAQGVEGLGQRSVERKRLRNNKCLGSLVIL